MCMSMNNHTEVHHCEFTSTYPNPEPDPGPNPYQARATKTTTDAITHLLNYCATHPDAVLQYHSSDMVLRTDSDAAYRPTLLLIHSILLVREYLNLWTRKSNNTGVHQCKLARTCPTP
jgi:hypothetical protein